MFNILQKNLIVATAAIVASAAAIGAAIYADAEPLQQQQQPRK